MELKNLELDHHELIYQNKHLCYQIDQVFNAWQHTVSVLQVVLEAYNFSARTIKFKDIKLPKLTENADKVRKALGASVGFARVGMEQTKIIENSLPNKNNETDAASSQESVNDTQESTHVESSRPLRGVSKNFSSLFSLPTINSATQKISCDNWLIDDQILKQLVHEGLDYASKLKEIEEKAIDLHQEQDLKKKRNSRKSLIKFSFQNATKEYKQIYENGSDNQEQGEDNTKNSLSYTLGEIENSDEDTAELLNDKLSTSYILQDEDSPRISIENKENINNDEMLDDRTYVISKNPILSPAATDGSNNSPKKKARFGGVSYS